MTIMKGFLTLAAFKKATVWGTPVLCAAGDGLALSSESIATDPETIEDEQNEANGVQRLPDIGNQMFGGSIAMPARYEGLEVILAQVFGTAGVPTTVDTTARKHVFKINDTLEGIFGTLLLDRKVHIAEFTTFKWTGFTLRVGQGKRATLEMRGCAHGVNLNTSAGTNTQALFASVTLPANREFLQFRQMVIRANAQAAGALAAGDALLQVNEVTIEVDRALKTDDVNTEFGNRISEPTGDAFATVKVSISFSKLQDGTGGSAAQYILQLSKAAQKMDITFTGDTLAGAATSKFAWTLYLNSVVFKSGTPNIQGQSLSPFTISGQAYRVLTIPTGFPATYTNALTMEVVSQRVADALA